MSDDESTLVSLFELQALHHGGRLAISADASEVSYADLNRRANRVAHLLLSQGVRPGQPIAVLLDQGAPFVTALLGVLKAGGCIVPLEPNNPVARSGQILLETRAGIVLTNRRNIAAANSAVPSGCAVLEVDTLSSGVADGNPGVEVPSETLACLLYTSGSTGHPKGVMHDRGSLLHNALRHIEAFSITPQDRQTLLYNCNVYGGIRDILNALLSGASLHVFPVRTRGVDTLADWMRATRVTLYCSVATVFRQFVASLTGRETFPDLRLIKLGGEASYRMDVELYRKHFPPTCQLHCGLGTTETGVVRHFFVNHDTQFDGEAVPLGYPVDDVEVMLLDETGAPVGHGAIGEIVVRSRFIAQGYWERPDLNDSVFKRDSTDPQLRCYHTGDFGIFRADGCLEHRGRRDSQVKIRGNRVELAEIEAALRRIDTVAHAAVIVRRDRHDLSYITAYIVFRDAPQTIGSIRDSLSAGLPDFMIPAVFVILDSLPQTPNGKIDRQALPAPDATRQQLRRTYTAPQSALEASLAACWAGLLDLDRVGVEDDFFDLGGNSLLAVQMMARIRAEHGRILPLALLIEAPTIRQLASLIARGHEKSTWSPLVPIKPRGRHTPLFCIHPGGGNVLGYKEFIDRLDPEQPVYGIQAHGVVEGQHPLNSVPEMARSYLEVVREVQPNGPYYLGGESFGGLVAYEMACELRRAGQEVAFIFLGDVWSTAVIQSDWRRFRLACFTYLFKVSVRDWVCLLEKRLPWNKTQGVVSKRYVYADELHRRNSIAHRQASDAYRPGRYDGKVTLFRAQIREHSARRMEHYFGSAEMGWESLATRGVEVHWMPDSHREMMHGNNAAGFARVLQTSIDSARVRERLRDNTKVLESASA